MNIHFSKKNISRVTPILTQRPRGGIKSCLLVVFTIFLIGILYVGIQFQAYSEYLKPIDADSAEKRTFEVKQGETLEAVAQRLTEEGFLKDTQIIGVPAYKIFLRTSDLDVNGVHAGKFEIPASASPYEIFDALRDEGCSEAQVTLREGLRIEEYADELNKVFENKINAKFNKQEFITLSKKYTKPDGAPYTFAPPANLEGFLFPDTYRLCTNLTTSQVIDTLLKNFEDKVYKEIAVLLPDSKLKLNEIVNIAAMVEREARGLDEKKMIADIIVRRLETGIPLGIDATSQYEFGYSNTQKTWWRKGAELDAVINTEHRYSTRKNAGLPPTPIANPGRNSITAVLEPTPNQYLFYITGNDGKMYYARTLNEHNTNVCRYITETCR